MDNDLIQDTNLDLLQVNAVEVEYSGISPINVDNQEHTISLDPSALSSKLDTSAFDEWTATHSAGEEYSAGEGIDITDHVISYTGDPGDATPWISGNKIITSADTMQPGEFIQVVSSFDLSGNKNHFITMKGQGYYFPTNQQLKERVDISSYLPTSAFSSYTASIASNLENNWNYTNSAYSQSLNNYYNKLDISAFSSWSSEHSGDYLTKESADTLYQPIGDYLTTADSGNFYPMEGNPSGFLTGVDLSNYYEKNETSSKEEIENAITSVENIINNLSGEYYPLTSNPSGYLTAHQSLDDYQKTADMTAYQEAGDYYSASNPSGFITGVDLSNYYEKNETSSKEEISDALTAIDNTISGLTGEFQEKGDYYSASNPSGFITGVDLTPYQEKTGMTAYQPVGDYYSASNPSGFITGVDLSNYYQKNETSSKEEISAALTGKLDESAFTAYTATAVQGIEYTGIAPIDVNNTTHEISADVWTLSGANGIAILEDSANKVTTIVNTAETDLSNYYTKYETSSKEQISIALNDKSPQLNPVQPVYISNDNDIGVLTWQLVPGENVAFTENSSTLQTIINVTSVPTAAMTAYYKKNETSSKQEISAAITGKQDNLTFAYNSSDAISSINGSALAGGGESYDTIDLSAGEGISIVETGDKVLISNNISAGSNMSFVYDSETNKIRIDANDAFPITAADGNTTWSADCKASAFTMARNTSRTDIGAFGFEYRQAPSVNVSGSWYDLALLMEKFMYAIPTQVVANSGMATGQNILYVVTGS